MFISCSVLCRGCSNGRRPAPSAQRRYRWFGRAAPSAPPGPGPGHGPGQHSATLQSQLSRRTNLKIITSGLS